MRKTLFALALIVAMVVMVVPASAQVPAPGGPYNSSFTIQNLETQTATCVFSLYDSTGAAKHTSSNITIGGSSSSYTYVGNIPVASGQYSAVISCDRQVAAVANTSSSSAASAYSGIGSTQTATTLYAPGLYKNYYGNYSNVVVQNTTGAPVNITLALYAPGSSAPVITPQTISNVPANASVTFDQAQTSALPLGIYSGKITATGAVAAQVNAYNGSGQLYAYDAFSSGSTKSFVPVLTNNYFGNVTALTVQNLSSSSATVKVTYSNGQVSQKLVAGNSAWLLYTPNEPVPVGFLGSATIEATGGNIVALVNESSNKNRAASYEGFKDGATSAYAPIVMKGYYNYSTSITCQNIGTAATNITIKYSTGVQEVRSNIAKNGIALFYQPNAGGLSNGFNGSAIVTSSGQKIVCVTNEDQVNNAANLDWLGAYDAISQ